MHAKLGVGFLDVIGNIKGMLGQVGDKAKRRYDIAVLELKIRNYRKEERLIKEKIGDIVYMAHEQKSEQCAAQIAEYCENIDNIRYRIKQVEKLIAHSTHADEAPPEPQKHPSLKKKAGDVKVRRTETGIQLVRQCPNCDSANDAEAEVCAECGTPFKVE